MKRAVLETRGGGLRLYLSGDLQFDSRDERLYHEPLALVPVTLAAARAPGRGLRVLILGGGDGLALREVLRGPAVREVHLVDRDPEVLALGRGPLAALNHDAFADPRTRIQCRDAREILERARGFDVLIYDLTYPADLEGASLFTVSALGKAAAALRPGGILAVNAVSPELTPQAFGCLGATLAAAGLSALAYAFVLPSFRDEGYGRWGFFYASPRAIAGRELRRLALPASAPRASEAIIAGTRLPAAAADAMRAAPNRRDELLYYLFNATPLPWAGPWRPLRFRATAARRGPRLTAAHGFARWLRQPEGQRSIEALVGCLPLGQRGQTREALLEWSHQAEVLFREVDLRAFVERALRRAAGLPRAWVRELAALRDRLRDGLPSLDEVLHLAYRVFAIYLLVLLLANLFFPDNLYAKGWSSSSGTRSSWSSGSGSGGDSAPFHGFHFTDPTARPAPYRFGAGGFTPRVYAPGVPRNRVYDRDGRQYAAEQVALPQPAADPRPVPALLALTPELQLLESGLLAYAAGVPGYRFLLEPARLRVLDTGGCEVMALAPSRELRGGAQAQLDAQAPLIDKALADHRRWLEWTGWASYLPAGRGRASELAELEGLRGAVGSAQAAWRRAGAATGFDPPANWVTLVPGVYLAPPAAGAAEPHLVVVNPEGRVERHGLGPPGTLTAQDRFLFRLLHRRATEGRDRSLEAPVARWVAAHGDALGLPRVPGPGSCA